jgi:multidrug efflux pump subunit AcrA (membrane-fusion protein)
MRDERATTTLEDRLFLEAANNWDLNRLYLAIDFVKQKQLDRDRLTPLEKAILRGLLCNYSPIQIATQLPGESVGLIINLALRLYRCIEAIAGKQFKEIDSYKYIPDSLEAAGYKQTIELNRHQNYNATSDVSFIVPSEFSLVKNSVVVSREVKKTRDREDLNDTFLLYPSERQEKLEDRDESLAVFGTNEINSTLLTSSASLPLVEENDFLPPIGLWTRLGGLFIVGSLGIAIALAAITPYNVTVKAQAKVRPAGELRIVEAQTEGKIIKIAVQENQTVKKGETIASIDNSRFQTKKNQLKSNIRQANLQVQQINAQIQAQQRQIVAETDKNDEAVEVARSQLSLSSREYQDKTNTSNAQVAEAAANLRLTEKELQKAQAQFRSAQANLKSTEASLNAAKSKLNRYQKIGVSGALSQDLLEETQLALQQQQQAVAAQQATVEQQQQAIEQQRQAVEAAKARLQNAQVALNPNNAEVNIAFKNIAREQATGRATLASLTLEKEALLQQRIEIEKQLAQDLSELKQVETEIDQTIIKAPAQGIVFQLNLRNIGQTVTTGAKIAQIVPSQSSVAIETLVSAGDISNVKIGQQAQIRISACPYPDYGTLKGLVSKVSPDVISLQNNTATALNLPNNPSQNNNADFYKVKIEPDSLFLTQGNKKCSLQLGMEGRADIIASGETVLKFLLRKARLITDL